MKHKKPFREAENKPKCRHCPLELMSEHEKQSGICDICANYLI